VGLVNPTACDLLVLNARPWSDGAPVSGADAIAVAGGTIVAVGRGSELEALAGPRTRRIDAAGGTATPGFADAHLHLVQWARSLEELSLHGAASRAEALERVARHLAAHPGAGAVVGRGWDSNGWSDPPDRVSLDRIAGERVVLLHSRDFHSLWVNGAALARAGLTRATPDPEGGRIERDAAGEPTGVLREHAVRPFAGLEPHPGDGSGLERVRRAVRRLHAFGITAVHDFEGPEAQRVLRALTREGGPRVRVLMHLAHAGLDAALSLGLTSGLGDDWFRLGAIKLFADGTLGSRTAALLEPYDGTRVSGLDLLSPADLAALVARASGGGLSVAVHAIGDRACRSALDAFEAAGAAAPRPALPPRIEHAQLVDPADVPRFGRLGVAASMQPIHCTSDFELAQRYWKRRAGSSYPWRALLEQGALLAFGSDAPVELPSAAQGLHAAVTRQRADGTPPDGFIPGQRVTLDTALAAYTSGPARLAGSWPRLGRLASGATADLVVWSADLHRLPPAELRDAFPRLTMVEGEVVHEAPSSVSGPGDALSLGAGGAVEAR
jgi:predicted amidohydrolase YtcJ